MRRRSPWALTLPLTFAGSWLAHVIGRAASIHGSGATEQLEGTTTAHGGASTLGVAAGLAPFAAVALIVLAARLWTKSTRRQWRGARPGWFLLLPALAYLTGEFLERLMNGGAGR